MTVANLRNELEKAGNPERAKHSQRFFKTGPGEYGEGDVFIGVSVPDQRKVAKKYYGLKLLDVEKLLKSKIHEERLTASIILVEQYKKGDEKVKKEIFDFYLSNTKYINNWDIIDGNSPQIVGEYLLKRDRKILIELAKSDSIWERRIAMLATFEFIHNSESAWTFKIATILLHDEHDLIQKAVGWMLREVGKRDFHSKRIALSKSPVRAQRRSTTSRLRASTSPRTSSSSESLESGEERLEKFLDKHYKTMPRTMLRYAIERFDEPKRQAYLKGTI